MSDNGAPLPTLDLSTARRRADEIRRERVAAIEAHRSAVVDAAEKKRAYRKARGQAFVVARNLGKGVTEAVEVARHEAADAEAEAETAAGMVQVQREYVDLFESDRAMLREFSSQSARIDGGLG